MHYLVEQVLKWKARYCMPKIRFKTERAANIFAQKECVTGNQWPYYCQYCDGWHLTKQEKRTK